MQRRRGAELETALLAAAWAELTESGYAAFTIDAVAKRAGTSRPVVYRRWRDKHELVVATLRYVSERQDITVPDTGSLRGDVVALMKEANRARADFAVFVSVHLGGYFEETGASPADLRELLLARRPPAQEMLLARAAERGEIDPAKVTRRIADLPFALFRHELLMTLRPVPDSVIDEIVDTIFLPLVSATE